MIQMITFRFVFVMKDFKRSAEIFCRAMCSLYIEENIVLQELSPVTPLRTGLYAMPLAHSPDPNFTRGVC